MIGGSSTNKDQSGSSSTPAVKSPETSSSEGKACRAKDILPNPYLIAPEEDAFDPDPNRFEVCEAVQSLPKTARPEERAPEVSPLECTQNNSPQTVQGEYEECPNPITVERTDRETGEVDWIDLPCNRKWCPYCGPTLRRRYVAHFTEVFQSLPNLKFITLTLDPKAFEEGASIDPEDFAESRKYLLHIWERKFVKRVKRRSDVEVKYMATVERHESGQAHLHAVISCTLSEQELRHHWFESGGGVVMDSCPILTDYMVAGKVGYAVKYCFEDAMEDSDGRNSIFCSEGIGYHSEAAKELRKEYREEENQTCREEEPDRYEYRPPTSESAGHKDNSDAVTDAEKERFDRIAEQARTTTYIDWDSDHMEPPVQGTRYEYDPDTGETRETRVRRTSDGGTVEISSERAT
jgi:hypothetical protein